jgi:anti-anti-sigma regulatory factor
MERIDGALALPEVPALVSRLRDSIADEDLALDLTGLTAIDVAGVQVLLSARAEAAARGRTFALRLPQDGPVPAMIARLGLKDAFASTGRADGPEQEITP